MEAANGSSSKAVTPSKTSHEILNPEELEADHLSGILPSALSLKEAKEHQNDFWRERLLDLEGFAVENCLQKHTINPRHRAEMVNWMIEVLHKSECQDLTFFKAVSIMDLFFARTTS